MPHTTMPSFAPQEQNQSLNVLTRQLQIPIHSLPPASPPLPRSPSHVPLTPPPPPTLSRPRGALPPPTPPPQPASPISPLYPSPHLSPFPFHTLPHPIPLSRLLTMFCFPCPLFVPLPLPFPSPRLRLPAPRPRPQLRRITGKAGGRGNG